ncbi:MAG: membrane protein insertase YidC [Burkholderiaceae bacterium]
MGSDFQRTILWVFFGMSLFMLWDRWQLHNGRPSVFGGPQVTQQQAATPTTAAIPVADGSIPAASQAGAAPVNPAAVPGQLAAGPKADPVVIDTDLLRVSIDPEGAVMSRAQLVQERVTPDWTQTGLIGLVLGRKPVASSDVVLLDVEPNRVYVAQTGLVGGNFPTHRSPFTLVEGPRKLEAGQDKLTVKFVSEAGGLKLTKSYTFTRGHYDVLVSHEVGNTGEAAVTPSLYYQLMRDGNKPDGESALYYTYTGSAIYTEEKKFQKIDFSDISKGKVDYPKSADQGWIAMIQHYFLTAWVPTEGTQRELYTREVDKNLFAVGSIVPLASIAPGASVTSNAQLYVGPQDQSRLKAIAPGLDLVVDYGWLTFLAKPIYWLLSFLHSIVGNWGWAIVLLTVLVKAVLFPLSAAGYKSMARMKEVGPRMVALREKYGEDKQKLNMAMMELYKTEKINPVGGCLPILLQIPVFLSLYWVLLASVELRGAPWMLWVTDLAAPDGWFILPVLMMATMWFQYKLNPTPPDPVQAKVMAVMPFIFGVMFFFFASGLVLYWLTNNILSIAQQWYVTKQIENEKAKRAA